MTSLCSWSTCFWLVSDLFWPCILFARWPFDETHLEVKVLFQVNWCVEVEELDTEINTLSPIAELTLLATMAAVYLDFAFWACLSLSFLWLAPCWVLSSNLCYSVKEKYAAIKIETELELTRMLQRKTQGTSSSVPSCWKVFSLPFLPRTLLQPKALSN